MKIMGELPGVGEKGQITYPPNVEALYATEGAFAAHHRNGLVTTWGHPFFGGESELVRIELHDIQWLQTNATMVFATRADLAVIYWGAHRHTDSFYLLREGACSGRWYGAN